MLPKTLAKVHPPKVTKIDFPYDGYCSLWSSSRWGSWRFHGWRWSRCWSSWRRPCRPDRGLPSPSRWEDPSPR